MSKTVSKFALAAGVSLALAFTFSCSGDDSDGDGNSSSSGATQGSGGSSSSGGGDKGNDIGNYRTVVIGTQTWMAENLNYNVPGSKCYGEGGRVTTGSDENGNPITKTLSSAEVQANCDKYGRLYDWNTALNVCPSGWHLPSGDDWGILVEHAGGNSTAGGKLKATSGWDGSNGTDEFDFSALPGGSCRSDGRFLNIGDYGRWWSAIEYDANSAYVLMMSHNDDYADCCDGYSKDRFLSVRCIQD